MASRKAILLICIAILLSGAAVLAVDPVPGDSAGGAGDSRAGTRITGINFKGTSDPARLIILASGPIQVDKQVNAQDKQLILNISGATLARGMKRKIDTSSFNGNVTLISPYQTPDGSVRIVVQLRQNVDVAMVQSGNQINLSVPSKAGPAPAGSASGSSPAGGDAVAASSSAPAAGDSSGAASSDGQAPAVPGSDAAGASTPSGSDSQAASTAPATPKDSMDNFLDNSKSKHFNGRPITLQLRDVDVADVFHLISEASGFNIVLGSDVKGTLTLSLTEVPWDQALDVVLETMNLGAERRGNVLRIVTLQTLADEKILELKTKIAEDEITPKIERVFPISYANIKDLKTMILDLAESDATGTKAPSPALAALAAQAGGKLGTGGLAMNKVQKTENTVAGVTVIADERTNSLIVKAIPETMERIKKVIELVDTQTPEVLINAKVIEASETFANNINGSMGFGNLNTPAFASFNNGVTVDPLLGSAGVPAFLGGALGQNFSPGTTGATIGLGQTILGNTFNAMLMAAVSEQKAKVVASPRSVVLNKQKADIIQQQPVMVQQAMVSPLGGTLPTFNLMYATLELSVTPTVTSDGSVLMDLSINRDAILPAPGSTLSNAEAPAERKITTNVLVASGATLVIGGFYTANQQDATGGFPILQDIPILGWLFKGENHSNDRDEMFFFITPEILNSKRAGITSS